MNYEISLIKLLQKICNGCEININKTGTKLIFTPGYIDVNDGLPIEHDCDLQRNITYYLEVACILAIYGKTNMNLTLKGNTDDNIDQCVDSWKNFIQFALLHFGHPNSVEI